MHLVRKEIRCAFCGIKLYIIHILLLALPSVNKGFIITGRGCGIITELTKCGPTPLKEKYASCVLVSMPLPRNYQRIITSPEDAAIYPCIGKQAGKGKTEFYCRVVKKKKLKKELHNMDSYIDKSEWANQTTGTLFMAHTENNLLQRKKQIYPDAQSTTKFENDPHKKISRAISSYNLTVKRTTHPTTISSKKKESR